MQSRIKSICLGLLFAVQTVHAQTNIDDDLVVSERAYKAAFYTILDGESCGSHCDARAMPDLIELAALKEKGVPAHYLYATEAAYEFGVPPLILQAIIKHEAGKTCQVKMNNDKSSDMGRAQINTIHADELVEKRGISLESVACDDRINALVAAWHLKNKLTERGGRSIWKAVGRYHDKRAKFADPYILRVKQAYISLLRENTR